MIAQTRPFACRAPRSSTATSTAGMSASATTSFSSSTRPKRPKRTWPPGTTRPRCSPKPAARAARDERSLPSSRLTRFSDSSTRTHPTKRGSWRPNPVRNPRGRKKYFFVHIYASVFFVIHQRRRALVAPPPPAPPKPRSTASKRDPLVTRPARTPAAARPARPASRPIALRARALAQIPAPRKPPAPRAVLPRA